MTDLRDLYQEVIIEHTRHPRNFGSLEPRTHEASGYNPLCGDKITVQVRVDGDCVDDVRFEGDGCSISTASASLMTEAVKGRSLAEASELFDRFHRLLTKGGASDPAALGKLAVMSGVRDYPVRVKCATLAWHTLRSALEAQGDVTTE